MAHSHHDAPATTCPACDIGPFARNHYFTGKLMLAADFDAEQRYAVDKFRHHHQRLHGWGVVCGLRVKQHPNPACRDRFVCIEPGTAVDCCGREIVLREEECVDVTQLGGYERLLPRPGGDPDERAHVLRVCVRYRECPTEEVPVLYDDCSCDETRCAPNRVLESYEFGVRVDPDNEAAASPHSPKLEWGFTAGPAHASRVAVHGGTRRLYVITADNQKTVYQLDADNHAVVGAHALPAPGLALAVADDGARLYVTTEAAAAGGDRQLVVLDTAANMGNAPVRTFDLPDSAAGDVYLTALPDGRLLALLGDAGDVQTYPATVADPGPASVSPDTTGNVGAANVRGFTRSGDGNTAYTADAAGNAVRAYDIAAAAAGAAITVLPANAQPSGVAVVASSAPDLLAVLSRTGKQLHLLGLTPPALAGSITLTHEPVAVAIAPGGRWAYVLQQDAAGAGFVQAIDLDRVRHNLPGAAGNLLPVGRNSRQVVLGPAGHHLYVPFEDDLTLDGRGGVAVLAVTETDCDEIVWRHLDGCPACEADDECVVLATVAPYRAGDAILDATKPPSDPVADAAANIARIDNRRGRQLLPSTQVLVEWIKCLGACRCGAGGGQGRPGDPGPAGLGIDAVRVVDPPLPCTANPTAAIQMIGGARTLVLGIPPGCDGAPGVPGGGIDNVRIDLVPCGQPATGEIVAAGNQQTLVLQIPTGCVKPELPLIIGINWQHGGTIRVGSPEWELIHKFGLVLAFSRPVLAPTLDPQTVQLLRRHDEDERQRTFCYCNLDGRVRPGAALGPEGRPVAACGERIAAFNPLPDAAVLAVSFRPESGFAPGAYRVVVKGDFILGEKQITLPDGTRVHPALDANHLGPGLTGHPLLPALGTRCPTGDGVEGGTFESWFTIEERG